MDQSFCQSLQQGEAQPAPEVALSPAPAQAAGQAGAEPAARPDAPELTEARLRAQLRQAEHELELLAGQLVETQDQLLAMYDLSKATRSHLGIVETLRHLAHEASRLVRAEGALLCVGPTIVQHPPDRVDELAVLAYLCETDRRAGDLLLSGAEADLPAGIDNLGLLPIAVRGDFLAVLGLFNLAGGFTAPDLKLARAIADQAGAHIEHALLYQETLEQTRLQAEMAVARQVQLQLLPQSRPSVPSLEIYAESRPALQVGGDFYDFVNEAGRPLMLLLGDIAGKGIPAAMIMGLLHTATRSSARFMDNVTPARVLNRASHDLYDDLSQLNSFATVFAAQYLPEQGRLRYANAGHAPVIYRAPCAAARLIEADGVPVGVLPDSLCEDGLLDFGPGALLVVTTDGFSEARDPGGAMFGYERLLRLVDEFADQPAQVIALGLFNAVDIHAGGQPQEDDQTLVVVKGVA